MRGGRVVIGLGNGLATEILKVADKNADQKLTADELRTVAGAWFGEFDKAGTGKLTTEQLTAGLGAKLPMPNFGGPPPGQ